MIHLHAYLQVLYLSCPDQLPNVELINMYEYYYLDELMTLYFWIFNQC